MTSETNLIPAPRMLLGNEPGHWRLDAETWLDAGPGTEGVARWLRATGGAATGLPFPEGRPLRNVVDPTEGY